MQHHRLISRIKSNTKAVRGLSVVTVASLLEFSLSILFAQKNFGLKKSQDAHELTLFSSQGVKLDIFEYQRSQAP